MVISDYIDANLVMPDEVRPGNKRDILRQIVDHISSSGRIRDVKGFFDDLVLREEIESTALGNQVAFPHARTDHVDEIFIAFARSQGGIEFQALDGQPVKIFFVIGTPKANVTEYLKVLAHLSQLMKSGENRQKLLDAQDPDRFIDALKELEGQ